MCGAMWCEGEVFYLPLLKSSTANHSSVLQTISLHVTRQPFTLSSVNGIARSQAHLRREAV